MAILITAAVIFAVVINAAPVNALSIEDAVREGLTNSPELRALKAKQLSMEHMAVKEGSMPDPMFMLGYKNEGFNSITYGDSMGSQVMISASQMFPYPGKRALMRDTLSYQAGAEAMAYESARLRLAQQIKETYLDIFLAQRSLEILANQESIIGLIEQSALGRYSSGSAQQQDVLMAQTEKYMLREKGIMLIQRVGALKAMLASKLGRPNAYDIDRLIKPMDTDLRKTEAELFVSAEQSPEMEMRKMFVSSAAKALQLANKEYYPDLTLTATLESRGGGMDDMWSVNGSVNIPLFYKTRQKNSVREAEENLAASESMLEAQRLMLRAKITEGLSMKESAADLMELYKSALIEKARQAFETSLSRYSTGDADMALLLRNLNILNDYETSYWAKFTEREKAVALIMGIIGEYN